MDFLKFVDISPSCFLKALDNTADVEILSMIGKLLVETNTYFKCGVPKYGMNVTLGQNGMDAKLSMLAFLLNEYQIRRQMVERCQPVENLPPVERRIYAKVKKAKEVKRVKKVKRVKADEGYTAQILEGYLVAMLWASTDNSNEQGGDPLDKNYDQSDIDEKSIAESKKDIEKFLKLAEEKGVELTKYDTETIGHDLWLTRNSHGSGFWDGDYEDEDGDILTDIARTLGNRDPYVGDDGKVYIDIG